MTLTEGMHEGEFIGELAMGLGYHIDAATILSGQNLVAGAVVAGYETGTATVTPGTPVSGSGGTVGNGTVGAWTADAGVPAGQWYLEITAASANAGKFKVVKPDGTIDGVGTVAVAYNGGINGTLADGSSDWVVGDVIPMVVAYAGDAVTPKFVEWNPAGTDGSQNLAGILVKATNATSGDVASTVLRRGPAVVNGNDITWKSGMSAANKLKGKAALLALGIKVTA